MKEHKVEISHKTIIFTILFIVGLYILFLIRDIILGVFISVMIMAALNPLVRWLKEHKVPRSVAIWMVFSAFIGFIILLIMAVIPPVINETSNLANVLPWEQISDIVNGLEFQLGDIKLITDQLGSLPKALGILTSTFSAVITIVTLLVMTFYLLLSREKLPQKMAWIFEGEKYAEGFVNKVEVQIGHWVRGEVALMLIVGLMTFIGLSVLGIPYALPLAIIAGFLEILPNIGPIISAIPAIIVAYISAASWPLALAVALLYTLIQQIENNLIVPQIMKSAVGVDPILTIILLLVGFRLGGVLGAALAIPLYLVTKVVLVEFYRTRNKTLFK